MQTKSSIGYIVVDDKDQDVIYYHYRDNSSGGSDGLPSVESSHLLLKSPSLNRNSKSYTKRLKQTLVLRIVFAFCMLLFVTIVCDKYVFKINICKQLYEMVCNGFTQNRDSSSSGEDNNLLMSSYESAVTVQTDCLQIVGSIEENAFVFKGIPYALPPTGARRWSRPQTLSRNRNACNYRENYFRANHFSVDCLQYNLTINQMVGEEDCLYLNVWTPRIDDQADLDVMIYIHGGLDEGSAYKPIRPSGQLARKMNSVFVSINYRLNAMGFLALDLLANANSNSSHANYGLWDVWEALQWIRHNIRSFGGHPHRLTLFGAEGQLITGLLSNSLYAELIRSVWIVGYNRVQTKHKFSVQTQYFRNCFLTQTNCSTVDCLQSMDAKNVLDIYHKNCLRSQNVSRLVYDDEILIETSEIEMGQTPVLILSTDSSDCLPSEELSNISSKLFSFSVAKSGSSHPSTGLDRNQLVLNSLFAAIDQSVESISQNIRQFGDELLHIVINFINERYVSMQSFNASIISCQTVFS